MQGNYSYTSEVTSAVLGVYPWFSRDAISNESYYSEPQSKIDKCLHCSLPECNNCDESCKSLNIIDAVSDMLAQKMNWREICQKLNISRNTFYRYKNILAIA